LREHAGGAEIQGRLEIGIGLTGEPDDDVVPIRSRNSSIVYLRFIRRSIAFDPD
jgi:hypothetical protein